jgi:bifunctional N-acetylglucosamine-1-phosphate-uridyltransferase/glucosamine-1-phosphate-acetyltransferase GlmU-like protein
MKFVLQDICANSTIVSMPMHKYGPVYTVQEVYNHIDDDEEVIVTYCDNPYIWDRDDFAHHVKDKELDGCILSHSGLHPHTLNNTKMAFMKTQGDLVTEIKEKECYTDNPMNEHASTGTYYFRKGSYIKKYFNEAMEKNIQYNGEYYVTLVYNLLIEDGLRVGYYDTPFATVMGTPEEVENIEAWNSIVNKGQVKNEDDLIACYRYWKAYHETGVV